MTAVAGVIQKAVTQACQEASLHHPDNCVAAVTQRMEAQIAEACDISSTQKNISSSECRQRLLSRLWEDPHDLKRSLPPKMKFVADNLLGPHPIESSDGITHRCLITFILWEVKAYQRDEEIPAEAKCMSPEEYKIFKRINQDRSRFADEYIKFKHSTKSAKPLQVDCNLVKAARAHSLDTGTHIPQWNPAKGDNPHIDSKGRSGHTRILAATRRFSKTAENIWRSGGMYLSRSEMCEEEFMNYDPGQLHTHRANILDPDLTHAGVGIYVHPDDEQIFVTQSFGGFPRDENHAEAQRAPGP